MKLEGRYTFKASREQVWNAINDPAILKKCLPGCEKLVAKGNDTFDAVLKVGVAAITGSYTGKVKITEKTPPSHYKLLVEGNGTPGFVRGEGTVDLEEKDGETILSYSGDAQVGGVIAAVGQRMIQSVAQSLADQFFKALSSAAAKRKTKK